ncbi:nucleoside phosphorylase [Microbacterium esteraromaticum]|uniref:Nucleoside phosphorylase n=1 Tax=Microbacterium esteraromaticum TaxID=57043 RepID=A0A7D8AFQ1_9MICO|nr:nucleoside phosphorylase [Microbacterium esteraromaticum]QMU97122.1 nucleoside phosphorylase [Microbacterium esteraromaticum]
MSALPTDRQHHIQVAPGEVGRYVLLPGDPGRSEPIARLFDEPRLVARNREYETWSGYLDGELVSVTSTGIGCPSAAIALEELVKVGADTFIRVGTSGAIQTDTETGELAIVTAAIRDEGTSSHYLPMEFPAVAHPLVVDALLRAARTTGARSRAGVSQSKDSFYGEVEPERMPLARDLADRWHAWRAGGAICSEMEASALFIVASILRVRAGGVMQMHMEGTTDHDPQRTLLLSTAVEALRELIRADREGGVWP